MKWIEWIILEFLTKNVKHVISKHMNAIATAKIPHANSPILGAW